MSELTVGVSVIAFSQLCTIYLVTLLARFIFPEELSKTEVSSIHRQNSFQSESFADPSRGPEEWERSVAWLVQGIRG